MRLSRYGLREWLSITLIAMVMACVFAFLGWWLAIVPVAAVWAALVAFFRDPARPDPATLPPDVMLAPADGTISAIEKVEHHEAVGGPAVIVRIFLSVLNVHVNRSPCDGQVLAITHRPGKYLDARSAESARVNESNLIALRRVDGLPLGVRQVSGAIARRIVCDLKVGQPLKRGQRFGMIKFGSTTELILSDAPGMRVFVSVGEPVRGGLSQLATVPMLNKAGAA